MRPYLAVIKDSFREARASRVLWILLILVTVTLLAIAPLGYRKLIGAQVEPRDCIDWTGLLNQVQAAGTQQKVTPAGQIWQTLPAEGRSAIDNFPRQQEKISREDMRTFRDIVGSFNQLLDQPELYDATAWPADSLKEEARDLLDRKQSTGLNENQLRRFNRLLVEAAFPRIMARSASENIMFVYGPWDMDFGMAIPFTEQRIERFVNEIVVYAMSFIVSTIGVFVAILATASQIKRIFDEGSINLLLSKPISRSLLYLSKYLGGCVFILIVATYFIAGLSLIIGMRFGVWEWRPLACVPLFVFMFMTYYCVSGLASIVWKNTIISIAAAIVFFFVCFLLGTAKQGLELAYINNISLVKLTSVENELVGVTNMGQTYRWDQQESDWVEIFQPKNVKQNNAMMNMLLRPRMLGPVIDDKTDRMLAIRTAGAARNMTAGSPLMYWGQRFDNYAAEAGPVVPAGPLGLYENHQGKLLVVAADGIYRLRGAIDKSQAPLRLLGMEVPFTGSSQPFERITPADAFPAAPPTAAAYDSQTEQIAIYSQGKVSLWQPTAEGKYEAAARSEVPTEQGGSALLALAGNTLMVVLEEGEIHLLDSASLEPRHEPLQPLKEAPKMTAAAPTGDHFVVHYHTGYVYEIDTQAGTAAQAPISGQGDISAITFLANGKLAAVDQAVRVTSYDLTSRSRADRYAPPLSAFAKTYYWLVQPLYTIFPKPGALDQTVRYVLTGEKTASDQMANDLSDQQIKLRPWAPIPSTALFIVIILGLSCWLMERQEF